MCLFMENKSQVHLYSKYQVLILVSQDFTAIDNIVIYNIKYR